MPTDVHIRHSTSTFLVCRRDNGSEHDDGCVAFASPNPVLGTLGYLPEAHGGRPVRFPLRHVGCEPHAPGWPGLISHLGKDCVTSTLDRRNRAAKVSFPEGPCFSP